LTIGYASNPDSIECSGNTCTGRLGYLITLAAERMGLELVPEQYAFAALVPALQSHRIDVLVAGFSVTQARSQVLYQGPPQYMGLDTLITKKGERIATYEEAAERGLILASVRGYLQIGNWEKLGVETHTWDNTDACVQDVLDSGAFGCAVGSLYYGLATARDPNGRAVQELEQNEITGPLVTADLSSSFTVAKDRPELARALAQQVRTLWRDGSAEEGWEVMGLAPEDYNIYLQIPQTNYYIPGPWEDGVVPPASAIYPDVGTIEDGVLTIGVLEDSALLTVDGEDGVGPEADVIAFVADQLGLETKYVSITDAAASLGSKVDVVAGALATNAERTHEFWMTQPVAFNPDYIYVAPDEASGALPSFTSWADVIAAGGKLGVVQGSSRADDVEDAGITAEEYPDAAAGLKALAAGEIQGFVTSTVEYAAAAAGDADIQTLGYVRNRNLYTEGDAFAWGVKTGDGPLIDALDQAITAAWQQKVILNALGAAWPGADVTALAAPGPTTIGTSFGASKDYRAEGMLISGPWLQYETYNN
jgi:polar amino acid transport system substrate-binding protein